jgi:hypothetical protein
MPFNSFRMQQRSFGCPFRGLLPMAYLHFNSICNISFLKKVKFNYLFLPLRFLQVYDEAQLAEDAERERDACEDPDVDGLEVGGLGSVVKHPVAHRHQAQRCRDPQGHATGNL